ncbi:hypothetical protein N7540_013007 [Penicillium herquei]|nr:hypothetical protein N7540_013007 [Penicillium herquei]
MHGNAIKPSTTAKLLGVVFDHELRWRPHVQQAVKRATKVNIALGGLRHLRPEQMRQLYEACVAPVIDYASTVWHDPLRDKTHLRTYAPYNGQHSFGSSLHFGPWPQQR